MPLNYEKQAFTRLLQQEADTMCTVNRAEHIWADIERRLPLPHCEHPIAAAESTIRQMENREK